MFEVLEYINEKYGVEETGVDIVERFDLIAGTSVGSVVSMSCNSMKSM